MHGSLHSTNHITHIKLLPSFTLLYKYPLHTTLLRFLLSSVTHPSVAPSSVGFSIISCSSPWSLTEAIICITLHLSNLLLTLLFINCLFYCEYIYLNLFYLSA